MSRAYFYAFALVLSALLSISANASPNCLIEHKAFQLAGDSIEYSMSISPGADCIQGLRWSTMQIYKVWILDKPTSGELVMVGPGFRYFANSDFSGTDKFSLVVVGKNLHEEGYSTVEIVVSPLNGRSKASSVSQLDSRFAPQQSEAETADRHGALPHRRFCCMRLHGRARSESEEHVQASIGTAISTD